MYDSIPEILCHLCWGGDVGRESVFEPCTQGVVDGIEGDGIVGCMEMDVQFLLFFWQVECDGVGHGLIISYGVGFTSVCFPVGLELF